MQLEKTLGVGANQKDAHIGLTAPVGTAGTVELSYLRKKDDLAPMPMPIKWPLATFTRCPSALRCTPATLS